MQELQSVYGSETKSAEILDQLHTVQKAHMRYIQEEYNSLQIGGQYGPQAKSMFKAIRRNTSVYTPAFIGDIKTVLNVTGAAVQRPPRGEHIQSSARPRFQSRFGMSQFRLR